MDIFDKPNILKDTQRLARLWRKRADIFETIGENAPHDLIYGRYVCVLNSEDIGFCDAMIGINVQNVNEALALRSQFPSQEILYRIGQLPMFIPKRRKTVPVIGQNVQSVVLQVLQEGTIEPFDKALTNFLFWFTPIAEYDVLMIIGLAEPIITYEQIANIVGTHTIISLDGETSLYVHWDIEDDEWEAKLRNSKAEIEDIWAEIIGE